MRKKVAAILPLYLASMIMLAFAVFPHHHHAEYICFNSTHCEQTVPDKEDHSKEHHDHDPFTEDGGCVQHLFQTEITKSLSLTHSDNCGGNCFHHFAISLFTLSGIMDILSLEAHQEVLPDKVFLEKLHSVLYTTDRAGRAPPFNV